MQQIAQWLTEIGLERYAGAFAENDIDVTVLRHLTDADLANIGLSLGHRRKLLAAIAELGAAEPVSPPPALPEPTPQDTAERRQVTVMFSDLVGSTALSARMDPEDLREVMSAYQKCVAETVRRFGGYVAKYMGDGVLVYFGYPQAHEHDAERAVRAGLGLVAAVSGLKTHVSLQSRVGIATGLVVVGDITGSGEAQERGIVGDTPNLAARLQGIAEPNMVVIADGTRKLLGNLFELKGLGARNLKGIPAPTPAWAALRASSAEGRFEALHATGLTALVGREEEAELLVRRWSRAKTGEGQVVLLSGEAGIGKSRLTAAMMERLAGEAHTRLRYFCSPQHTDSTLYPVIGQIERAAGLAHEDTPQAKLDKLDAVLARSSTSPQDAALFAELLSLPNDGRYPSLELTPQQRRQRTLEALTAQIDALTRFSPALMIFEDAHWADPTSLEVIDRAVDRIASHRVLLIVTFRPEFKPAWIGRPHVTVLTLNRLATRDVGAMIDRVVADKLLTADIRQDIIERSDGIPLFVEEMTKAVLEAESEGDARRIAGAIPLSALAVPATLQASLMARLDRLGPAKEVAQIGAALGRQFSHDQLAAVVRKPEPELESALDRLIAAGLLLRAGVPPHATYLFNHALVQDAAYGTLLRSRRQQMHGRIAATLEEQFSEVVQTQPELLARHCAEAGFVDKAVDYWLKAGQQAIGRWAITEAVAQLQKGLELVSGLPEGVARHERELSLQIPLGYALTAAKGYSASEPGEAFDRARQLCEQLNRPPQLMRALGGLLAFRLVRGDVEEAGRHAQEMHDLGKAFNNTRWIAAGSAGSGCTCYYLGKFNDARAHYETWLSSWDPTHRTLTSTPEDYYIQGIIHFSRTLLCLGYLDEARLRRDEALAKPQQSLYGQAWRLCMGWNGDWATWGVKGVETMLRSAEEILAVSDEEGFGELSAIGTTMHGWCLAMMGQVEEGISLILKGLAMHRATRSRLHLPFGLMVLAEAYGIAERPQDGLNQLAEAAKIIEVTKECWAEAELHRLRGTLLLSMSKLSAAEDSYDRALSVARRQNAKFWELRAARDLAKVWVRQGKRAEARDLLSPVYEWFTQGFDTPDLQDAKALLARLA
jgi:class 3 adenylate cyclase/tetratricopeptide (TPR) repeat protein